MPSAKVATVMGTFPYANEAVIATWRKAVYDPAVITEDLILLTHELTTLPGAKKALLTAIRAGIRLLQKRMGLKDSDIKHILLAGGFGNYIRRESALRIGLLPSGDVDKIRSVGNAAGLGSQLALLSRKAKVEADNIAATTEHLALTNNPEFQINVFCPPYGTPYGA